MHWLNFEATLASPKGEGKGFLLWIYGEKIFADLYSLIFGISPLAFVGLVTATIFSLKKDRLAADKTRTIFYFLLFILFYYFASTVNSVVATVRYQIILYPLAFVIAAIGLTELSANGKIKKYLPDFALYLAVLAICAFSLFAVRPFFFAYNSEILPTKYFINFKDMGDGSWEVANFFNQKPEAEKLTIWSDKGAVCAVFKGRCIIGFNAKELGKEKFDYVVVSSGRKSRTLKLSRSVNDMLDFAKAYKTTNVAYEVVIANRPNNFVKVLDAKEVLKVNSTK